MKVLIIGGGAREHALGLAISQNKSVNQIYFAPGNAGTTQIGANINIKANDIDGLLAFAKQELIDYTVVGPEDPLCEGIVDCFEAEQLAIFGPSKAAAQLEGSKAFAKEFMVKHAIPTAAYKHVFNYEEAVAEAHRLLDLDGVAVLKADTLCQGKGVFIAYNKEEATQFCREVFVKQCFGSSSMVIEEFLDGFELSLLCFVDNHTIVPLPTAKDHKKIGEGEIGLNTGGMGTYSPNPQADVYLNEIEKQVLQPFLKGIQADKLDYRGIIFLGFMVGSKGIKVLEFNTRFGDPETQSVLQRLDSDLLTIMQHTSAGKLNEMKVVFNDKKVISLVLASGGYPQPYASGFVISGLDACNAMVFHAGTKRNEKGEVITCGGRVLTVTAVADSFEEAHERVYAEAKKITFDACYFRRDISPAVKRVYVEKKQPYNHERDSLIQTINDQLHIPLKNIRCFQRYDLQHISDDQVLEISNTILSESPVDHIYLFDQALKLQKELDNALVVQYHKGQFDQREQGLLDTVMVALGKRDLLAKCAKVYAFEGENNLTAAQLKQIEQLLVNPVDQEKGALLNIPTTLSDDAELNASNPIVAPFIELTQEELLAYYNTQQFAMSFDDLAFVQSYFIGEKRNPTTTELAIIDTYWSDHCRHTTFMTILDQVEFKTANTALDHTIKQAYNDYLQTRDEINRTKPVCLMDLATIVAKFMRKNGLLDDLEVSDEINACSVKIKINVTDHLSGEQSEEDYLLMFKNETHNHPTEIEPYGGASTCIGGAIRDPLSGRSYVYQAMRVTGAADPREAIEETLEGKLPQRKITTGAAAGFSAYGNQIGLTTGQVTEIYHPGYKAKRMEVGAVIGAAPAENVKRLQPEEGDAILLLGGRTGRDGIGGATGSSKEHTEHSIKESSAEVQKGNAPMERKLQRLFRNATAAQLIKKCNDFGAGGVCVAIGELADSLEIWLDRVPLKYQGLTPREIAISESQERMAVVVEASAVPEFMRLCVEENLEVTHVASVTNNNRLVMTYGEDTIVDINRDFLNTSGTDRRQEVTIENNNGVSYFETLRLQPIESIETVMADLNVASQKNLTELFDSSIGAGSVLVPLGGKNQITPTQAMAGAIPSLHGISSTASLMAYGYNPYLSEQNPFLGAYYAVIESVSKIAATGGDALSCRLSFQEYFERLGNDPVKWGKPLQALLGAFAVTKALNLPPIGGKDSMSGSFKEINVPPTLISFAVTTVDNQHVVSPELKGNGALALLTTPRLNDGTLNLSAYQANLALLRKAILGGKVMAAASINHKGLMPQLFEMALGNDINFMAHTNASLLFDAQYGSFIVELCVPVEGFEIIGQTGTDHTEVNGKIYDLERMKEIYMKQFDQVFVGEYTTNGEVPEVCSQPQAAMKSSKCVKTPKVVIPVFPGTNCEYDSAQAFIQAGAQPDVILLNNLSIELINQSIERLAIAIREAQILMFPGGFSLGDEPDGSGKFIANVIRNPKIAAAIEYMLEHNDGLILGICNGFQALIKTGLLPYGKISKQDADAPTLTFNTNGRHIARFVDTKAVTTRSPWLALLNKEAIYKVPISHGEGRIVCNADNFKRLQENDQIAFIYLDNPNGSDYSIEGLITPDGKILGKMAHTERLQGHLYKNIPNVIDQAIIKSGVNYFKK